jgi:thiamine pyrophosphate-dependent acetolactate synthase large subunit-like protein
MIVFGQGIILWSAEALLKEFVEKSGIPAAWTILGRLTNSSRFKRRYVRYAWKRPNI